MPKGYERMRDRFIAGGMTRRAAQRKAARIWNSRHPRNPVGRHKRRTRSTTKRRRR